MCSGSGGSELMSYEWIVEIFVSIAYGKLFRFNVILYLTKFVDLTSNDVEWYIIVLIAHFLQEFFATTFMLSNFYFERICHFENKYVQSSQYTRISKYNARQHRYSNRQSGFGQKNNRNDNNKNMNNNNNNNDESDAGWCEWIMESTYNTLYDDSTYLQWTMRMSIDIMIRFISSIIVSVLFLIWFIVLWRKEYSFGNNFTSDQMTKAYLYQAILFVLEFIYFLLVISMHYRKHHVKLYSWYLLAFEKNKRHFLYAWIMCILFVFVLY